MKEWQSPRFRRQLLIGLDAAEWNLIVQWAGAGKLPTFHRLMVQGVRAELSTTAEQLPDTVWASLYTGSNPAKFEKFFYVQYDGSTGDLRHVPDDAIRRAPFWDYLSQAGCRVGIVDAPKFPLSKTVNGFQLTNWGAHATKTARASTPPSLLSEIETRFGEHPVGDCDAVDDKPKSLEKLRQHVLDGVRLRGRMTRSLMQERPWDVFFAAFSETHCIGHHFWRGIDAGHPRYEETRAAGLADTLEQVYVAIDREIGEMLALAGDDTLCMVFAAHGMGPIYHASWNLPEILHLLGYGNDRPGSGAARASRKGRINPWRILKMVMPGKLQYAIKALLPSALKDELLFRWYAGARKWKGCRAFSIPNNDSVGAIRISVRGRDKDGIVAPGREYDSICRDIANALYELTDPKTGRPVVRRVTLSREEFHGPFVDQLPDLTVLWDQSFPWEALHSPRFGTLDLRRQDGRSGGHSSHGFVLAVGPGVPAGVEMQRRSIYDIAPTILEAAGVTRPDDLDGQAIPLCRAAVAA